MLSIGEQGGAPVKKFPD